MAFYNQLQDITLLGLVFAVICLWKIISTHARSNKSNSRPPEPAGAWPVIGHLRLLGANKILHHIFGDMADKYGPIFSLQLGIHNTLVVSNWEVAKECLKTQDKVFSNRPKSLAIKIMGYDAILGFLPYGPYWRDMRKLAIVELLSTRRLDMLKHVRESEVNSFVRELYKQCISNGGGGSKAVVEMKQRFADLAINIVVRMVAGKRYFGTEVYGDEEARRFQKAMWDFEHLLGLSMVSDAVPLFGWIDALRGYKGKMKKTAKEIDHVLGSWVKEHRQKRETQSINESEQDFIQVMLSVIDGSHFTEHDTDKAIKGTCFSLILGGYDTTMITLTWAVSLLLNNRHVLRKVQDELNIHVGRDRQVIESDVKNLTYLQAIVKETLRLYPPAPLSLPHEAMSDCTVAGFHIPAGTRLLVNLWKLHRDPNIWSDPLEFQPDRFLQKHVDVDIWGKDFELIPFGSGRRSCPGITFALQFLHLTLARLLHGFELGTVSDSTIDMNESAGITNPKATPLEITLTPRLPPQLYV
uniref:Cytochrome P450 CYP82H28 n=1 Tax=Kalopanax septemlobus TaxID=228393 RepID=A0A0S2III1_KALSE|nr:cytochrome P450 CYP82H28 [Kalopanax septemlobus]